MPQPTAEGKGAQEGRAKLGKETVLGLCSREEAEPSLPRGSGGVLERRR